MAHRDLKPRLVGKPLQPLFVTTRTGSVAAARIRFDHQSFRLGVVVLPVSLPPVTEGIGGESRERPSRSSRRRGRCCVQDHRPHKAQQELRHQNGSRDR